jgi:hypothetical protein
MGSKEDMEEDVESMLEAISLEVQGERKAMVEKKEKRVEINEPMDIEGQHQQQFN